MLEHDKSNEPLISILMAVYEPKMDWLREQLVSLNSQTYQNIVINVIDDCSPTVLFNQIEDCVAECITHFPYTFSRNKKNLGSNLTFEKLTVEAHGDYLAYCDQDDVWLPDRVERCFKKLKKTGSLLVCGDTYIIDAEGKRIAESITNMRPRHIFYEGCGLEKILLYRNFVVGCTMLVDARTAKMAVPFVKSMVHDHYLALYCSLNGSIAVCKEPVINYRIHNDNQTGVLSRIETKQDYYEKHLHVFTLRTEELRKRFSFCELENAADWSSAREDNYYRRCGGLRHLWTTRRVNFTTSVFELLLFRMPDFLFRFAVKFIKLGKI
ncbi:MAG: glycosyltransferase [Candidatus Fimivivens sp.]|nr:glycosyltransferase [Candidatus Fimivivens sp.]